MSAKVWLNLPEYLEPIPVTNLFDYANEEVDDWDEAYVFVAGPLPDGTWMAARTEDYQDIRRN